MAQPETAIAPETLGNYLTGLVRMQTEKAGGKLPYSPESTLEELKFDEYDPAEIGDTFETLGMSGEQADEVYRMFLDPVSLCLASKEKVGSIVNRVLVYIQQQAQANPRLKEGLQRVLAASP